MRITIDTSELDALSARLRDMGRNVRRDTVRGLNDAAFGLARRLSSDIASKIDSPRPFSQKSMMVTQKAAEGDMVAVLDMKPIQRGYLTPLLQGGARPLKRIEQRFMGRAFVPGRGLTLDRYGNVPKATLLKLVRAIEQAGPARRGRSVIFMGRPHPNSPEGVWMRTKKQLVPLLIFKATPPVYARQIDFYRLATEAAQAVVGPAMQDAIRRALETA